MKSLAPDNCEMAGHPVDQTSSDITALRALFDAVRDGRLTPEDAERHARDLAADPFEDLGFARVDHHRAVRQGFPEVIFGQGKSPEQVAAIPDRCRRVRSCADDRA